MKYQYHDDGTQPHAGQVFVFGSNLAGFHGAGAARAARKFYGAVLGQGVGYAGSKPFHSYAIPTKDQDIITLPIGEIEHHVILFKAFANNYPDMQFFVSRVGCGLAGYRDSQIAPLFKGSPDNCSFAREWAPYLEQP